MKETINGILRKYVELTPDTTFIVGFSGGWDSMCMLHILRQLSIEHGFKVIAAHLNHNWRGDEADKEELICKKFCEQYEIPFVAKKLPDGLKASELIAREMRYAFFKDCAAKFAADAILTAHTRSDNAETILYRIIKGTGLNGLEGIKECRDVDSFKVIRPILNFSRKSIEAYCIKNELFPNSDSSNLNTKYARNNIRHNIMPALKNINQNIEGALINLSEMAIGNNKIIQELIQNIEKQITVGEKWLTKNFMLLNPTMKQHFIYNLLIRNDIEPSFSKVQEILNFIIENQSSKSGKTLSLTEDIWLFTSSVYTYTVDKADDVKCNEEIQIKDDGLYTFGSVCEFSIHKFNETVHNYPKADEPVAFVDLSDFKEPLTLRTRRNGDIIQPFGMDGKMKLKKYFINKNIPSHDRDKIILLCCGKEVLWAIGVGLSEKLRTKNNPSHKLELVGE
ncbi:MAG: tRNA lysidine(34) synthetase TilS [Candidatus Gastranaerophilales bacterium]|nr:tRNA lysidine(34) synthetase TilS [Candidatus Gastranaerophilales bacterium]